MASIFEKAVKEAKVAQKKRRTEAQDNVASSGLFRVLSLASTQPDTMEQNKILPEVDDKGAITAFKVLRTRVLQRLRSNGWRNFIVSGAGQGEGKTLTACNLAVSMAQDVNQSVFLVDLDLQHSSVSRYFGLDINLGIGDYLTGNATIDDIIYSPREMDRIAIIPNREPVPNPSELIASPKMKALVKWLKDQAGAPFAIFDMPPILACDDVLAFLPSVDAVLLIVSEGVTERRNISRAMEMLGDVNLLGVVLNRSKEHNKVSPYY